MTTPLHERFWSLVHRRKRGCWLWMGNLGDLGYGRVKVGGRLRAAHRVAYALAHDVVLSPSVIVRQKCGERRCCNPAHLEMLQVVRLTEEQRDAIRRSLLGGRRLAPTYGVSARHVCRIRSIHRASYGR